MMKIILLTAPEQVPDEAAAIAAMLESGAVWRVHLRRPGSTMEDMRTLIESIPRRLYPRLTLHDHHRLGTLYGLGGLHLNGRCPVTPSGWDGLVSQSCHSIEEVAANAAKDYLTLSPVFDSISKYGYLSAFTPGQLARACASAPGKVMALGGVTPQSLPRIAAMGFAGAAMLGYVWEEVYNRRIDNFINQLQCYNS